MEVGGGGGGGEGYGDGRKSDTLYFLPEENS